MVYEINERFRQIFKTSGLSQEKFADRIKRSRGEVANILYDKTVAKDKIIEAVCDEFGVNETWLRTGEGEMFKPVSKDAELAAFMGDIMHGETADFRRRLVAALARFGPDEWELLERMVSQLAEEYKKED